MKHIHMKSVNRIPVILKKHFLHITPLHSAAQEVGEVWPGQNFLGAQSTKFQNYSIFEEFGRKKHGFSQIVLWEMNNWIWQVAEIQG